MMFIHQALLRMLSDLRTYSGEETKGFSGMVREGVG